MKSAIFTASAYDCLGSIIKAQNLNELLNTLIVELIGYQQQLEQTIKYAAEIGGFGPTIQHMEEKLANVNRTIEMVSGDGDVSQPL